MTWRPEAPEIEYLSYNRDGGKSINVVEAAQEADARSFGGCHDAVMF